MPNLADDNLKNALLRFWMPPCYGCTQKNQAHKTLHNSATDRYFNLVATSSQLSNSAKSIKWPLDMSEGVVPMILKAGLLEYKL